MSVIKQQNHLFQALPDDVWQRWQPHVELTDMALGRVIYESGVKLTHAYFPANAIVSLLYVLEDGHSAEIAVVGDEGMVGVSLIMGGVTPSWDGPWFKVQAKATVSSPRFSSQNSTSPAKCCICCCATHRP